MEFYLKKYSWTQPKGPSSLVSLNISQLPTSNGITLLFYSLGKKKRNQLVTEPTPAYEDSPLTPSNSATNPSFEETPINNQISQHVVTESTPAHGNSPQTTNSSITNPTSEENDKLIDNQISQAISMDFFETIAENNLSQTFIDEMRTFFESDNCFDERMFYDLG